MRSPKYVLGAVALAMLCVATACGSTVQQTRAQRVGTQDGESSELGGFSGDGSSVTGDVSTGGLDGSTTGGGTGSSSSGGSSVSSGGKTVSTVRKGEVTTRGVTDTTVQVGIATSDADSFAKTLGISLSSGDTKAQLAAISKEIDKRGGILGRRLEFVYHQFNTAQSLNDSATANQAACADWTQDHHVFAVFSITDVTMLECLKRTDTPLIDAGAGWGLDGVRAHKTLFNAYPNFFILGAMLGDRFDDLVADRMAARNFLEHWDTRNGGPGGVAPSKLGLMVADTPNGDSAVASMKRALARKGITPAIVFRYDGTLSGAGASAQNAVLQFKAQGITHVWGAGGTFIQAAEQQNYRPRYWFPIGVQILAQLEPPAQMNGSMAVSITPAMDNGGAPAAADVTPASAECKKIMRDAGQTYSDTSVLSAMQSLCDQLFFFQAAIQKSGNLTTAGLRQGLESLGDRLSAETFVSMLGPNDHAPARAARDLSYNTGCKCFPYATPELIVQP